MRGPVCCYYIAGMTNNMYAPDHGCMIDTSQKSCPLTVRALVHQLCYSNREHLQDCSINTINRCCVVTMRKLFAYSLDQGVIKNNT